MAMVPDVSIILLFKELFRVILLRAVRKWTKIFLILNDGNSLFFCCRLFQKCTKYYPPQRKKQIHFNSETNINLESWK